VRVRHTRHWVAAAVLLVEVAALVLALTLPAFRVQTVTVSGNRLVSTATLLRTADVPSTSIFTVDGDSVRSRLMGLPWVQDVTVTTDLPSTVHIAVVERASVLRVRRGGSETLVAGNGAALPATSASAQALVSIPVLVDDRIGSATPIDPSLLQMLSATAQRFQSVFGCTVAAFQWGADDVFAVWASTGWRAILGHLNTDAAIARIPAQLAALAALKTHLDFAHPGFGYVDLDNIQGPAAGGAPGLPQEILKASLPLSGSAQSSPSSVAPPVSTPTPTPAPSPSPNASASPGVSPASTG
jgi:cell division septal protein FtsQ